MLNVFLFMWCKDDLGNQELKACKDVTKTVINTIKVIIRNITYNHITNEELKAQINSRLNEAGEVDPIVILTGLQNCCETIALNLSKDDYVAERARKLYKITWLYNNLIQGYEDHLLRINSQIYLRDDLLRGAESIEKSISNIKSKELRKTKIVEFFSTISNSVNSLSDLKESDDRVIDKVALNEQSLLQ